MRIVFVAPRYHPNQHGWASTLLKHGHVVRYLVLVKSENERYDALTPDTIRTTNAPWLIRIITRSYEALTGIQARAYRLWWPEYTQLKRYLTDKRPEVLIVRDLSTWLALQAVWCAWWKRIPCILYTQQPLEDPRQGLARWLEKTSLLSPYRITPVRQSQRWEKHPHEATYFVPLIVPNVEAVTKEQSGTPRILFVGKFDLPRKNHLLFLRALQKVDTQSIDFTATLVGSYHKENPEYFEEIRHYCEINNLEKKVRIQPNVPPEQMADMYASHDIFVLPSSQEPYAISVIEAMSYGLPVIVAASSGGQHCASCGGLVVKDNDENDLTEKLTQLLKDKSLRKHLGIQARKHVEEEHSSTYFYERFMNAVRNQKNHHV